MHVHTVGAISRLSFASVNCYLVNTGDGFVLIDSGKPENRIDIQTAMTDLGCVPGRLHLIVVTHGDYDHAGNAVYLQQRYATKVAMHPGDAARVEHGDWSLGFKTEPDRFGLLFRMVARFIQPGPFDTFSPDIYLADGQTLSGYGLDATVVHLPGHTPGSIGVLLATGELFCGDLLDSMLGRPGFEFFIDDMGAARESLRRLRTMEVGPVYPGHGKPFTLDRVSDK